MSATVAEAYRQMLAAPADPEVAFQYARIAAEQGDFAAAIAGFERVLLLDPERDNIRYELGLLYQRVGNADRSTNLLNVALQSPAIPGEIKPRAERALEQNAEAGRLGIPVAQSGSRPGFSGQVYVGGRYETNPRQAPTDLIISGIDSRTVESLQLSPTSQPQEDFSFEASLNAAYTNLIGDDGDAWYVSGSAYSKRQDKTPENHLGVFSAETGFEVALGGGLVLQPFFRASHVQISDNPFATNLGGGLTVSKPLGERLRVTATVEAVSEDYRAISDVAPLGDELDGTRYSIDVALQRALSPATVAGVSVSGGVKTADVGWEAFNRIGAGAFLQHRSGGVASMPIVYNARVSYEHSEYEEPEDRLFGPPGSGGIAPFSRSDDRFSVVGSAALNITRSLSASLTAEYTDRSSNTVNFDFDNFSVRVGVGYQF